MVDSVTYLGHQINADGLHPVVTKFLKGERCSQPIQCARVKGLLGPAHVLRQVSSRLVDCPSSSVHVTEERCMVQGKWTKEQKQAFQALKDLLTCSSLLVHLIHSWSKFLPAMPRLMVLELCLHTKCQMVQNSQSGMLYAVWKLEELLTAEEALACVFGMRKFTLYSLGTTLISPQASACVCRWALLLSMYEYTLRFWNITCSC